MDDDHDDDYAEPCDCGGNNCDGFKRMLVDPYQAEINEDYTLYLMCGEDAAISADDI